MFDYNLNMTIDSILTVTRIILDIAIVWFLIYYSIKIVRNNSRTIQIFKGIVLIVIIDILAKFFGLVTLGEISSMFMNWGFLAIIIIFQPEIRALLERLGKSNAFSRISNLLGNEKEQLVDELVKATTALSRSHTGALITIEQSQSLQDYVRTGIAMDADVTAELLTSIFVTSTPLHDGAVIIKGDKIACASAYFPPTNIEISSKYGARHRAAIGISEITDSITIVVSEETGSISIADKGHLVNVTPKALKEYLMRVICNVETDVSKPKHETSNIFVLEDNQVEIETQDDEEVKPKRLKDKLFIKRQKKVTPQNEVKDLNLPLSDIENKTENEKVEDIDMKLPMEKPTDSNVVDQLSNVVEIRRPRGRPRKVVPIVEEDDSITKQMALLDDDSDINPTVEKTEGDNNNDRK